jgi:hypothetical protein
VISAKAHLDLLNAIHNPTKKNSTPWNRPLAVDPTDGCVASVRWFEQIEKLWQDAAKVRPNSYEHLVTNINSK